MDFEEFNSQLSDEQVRGIIILQIAMMVGAIIFGIAVLFMGSLPRENNIDEGTVFFANILSAITGLLTFNCIIIYNVIAKVRHNAQFIIAMFEDKENIISFFVSRFRGTRIIQMALLEGAAFMGIISYFLTSMNGITQTSNLYLLNYLPLGVLVVIGFMTLPSKRYLYNKYKNFESMNELLKTS